MAKKQLRVEEETKAPLWTRRVWTGSATIEVALFDRLVETNGGEVRTFNVSMKRVYKVGDDYKEAKGFRAEDLPFLVLTLSQAYAFVSEELTKK